jgi:hypothetical protein
MIITEGKEVTKVYFDQVPVSGYCDVCKRELKPVDSDKLPKHIKDRTDIYDYYRIATHHHDWGNDSIESYEYTDCCCIECALKFIQKYWDNCTMNTPWPTKELEMKHEWQLNRHPEFL